jgi:hypothetical protein
MAGDESLDEAVRIAFEALMRPPVQLAIAEARVTSRCMQGRGFRYPAAEALDRVPSATPSRLGGLGRPLHLEEATRVGYGFRISPRPGTDPVERASGRYLSSLSHAEQAAYQHALAPDGSRGVRVELSGGLVVGAASQGCVAEARKAVYGSVQTFLRLAHVASEVPRVADAAMRHRRVRAAVRAYSGCMAGKGIPVGTPMLAVKLAEERFGGTRPEIGPVSDAERDMAVADAICQQRTGVNEAIDDAVIDAASWWLRDEAPRLLELAALQGNAVESAREILEHAADHDGS